MNKTVIEKILPMDEENKELLELYSQAFVIHERKIGNAVMGFGFYILDSIAKKKGADTVKGIIEGYEGK